MKTQSAFFLCFFISTLALAQTTPSAGARPPVPGETSTVEERTGGILKNQNEEAVKGNQGAIKRARVYFIEPQNGATVPEKFKVKMAVEGYKIRPAGEAPDDVTSGHHHIIINGEAVKAGVPLPMDEKNIHFGKGQTETELQLKPGQYSLTLQFADGAHRSFGPRMSQTIKIKVK